MQKSFFYYLVVLCILTHIIRTIYEILKHKKVIKASGISFIIIFADMALLWISWFTLCALDAHTLKVPGIIRISGITLVVAGTLVFLIALAIMKTLENYNGDLVTRGIYSKIRHPMYLGFIFWLLGTPLHFGGITSFILCIIFIANVLFWRHMEEIELINRFPEYINYQKRTWF